MPRRPPPGPASERLGPGRDRLVGCPAVDIIGLLPTGRVAVFRPIGHRLEADRFEGLVERRVERAWPPEIAPLDRAEHRPDVIAPEWGLPGEQTIEGGAQAV